MDGKTLNNRIHEMLGEQGIKNYTELDMMEDPKVSHISDLGERTKKASSWLECRYKGLENQRQWTKRELMKASDGGNLDCTLYMDAKRKLDRVFNGIKSRAEQKYQEVIKVST